MKKYITILAFSGIILCSSCEKDFLKEVATNQVVSGSYFNNTQEASTVLAGVYQQLQNIYRFESIPAAWGMNGTDEVTVPTWAGSRRNLHVYNIQTNNVDVLNMWTSLYVGIYRANQVINRVGAMSESQIKEVDKNRILGEARFLRGMYYFSLTKIFGSVPLTVSEISSEADIPNVRTPVANIYEQIIEDLTYAKANCSATLVSGVATQGAATALLGRVYLQMTGWPLNDKTKFNLAANEFKAIIDNPLYGLCPVYADIFDFTKENDPSVLRENIFVVKFDGPGKGIGGQMGTFMGPDGNVADGGAFNTTYVNVAMVNKYDQTGGDTRFTNNIAKVNASSGAAVTFKPNWKPWKWRKPLKFQLGAVPNFAYDSPIDYQLIRFSDVLLMYAEALNAINGGPTQAALDAVNRVRMRAKLSTASATVLPNYTLAMNMTENEFLDAILKERYFELNFEGLRKDDLIRTGKLISTLQGLADERFDNNTLGKPGNIKPFHRNFPVPDAERQVSGLEKTEGY